MNAQIIQNLQDKLLRRASMVRNIHPNYLLQSISRFLNYLESDSIFHSIIKEIPDSQKILDIKDSTPNVNLLNIINFDIHSKFETENEIVCVSYKILHELSKIDLNTMRSFGKRFDSNTGGLLDGARGIIISLFFEPFCQFIEEKLIEQRTILNLLYRYKHRCEWFQQGRLLQLYKSETKKGEKLLALDLYQYLFDEGVNFTIEPSSIDGSIDLISAQNSEDPLLADAKIFKGNKTYICRGFGQLYSYTGKYNEPFGYLVIYNVTDKDISFLFENSTSNIPMVTYNHKTIFFITIDLFKHSDPPSKRGLIKPVEIKQEDLFQFVETE